MEQVRGAVVATLLVAAAWLGTCAGATSASATTGSLGGNVEPALDTVTPGTVGVAASGAPTRGVVPVVVQNATRHAVARLRIRATAATGSGRVVAHGATRNVIPEPLAPQALALARVDFHDATLPPGLTYRFHITAGRARRSSRVALEPTGFRLSPPTAGAVAQTLAVTLHNPTDARLTGPLRVAVMCFGESSRPVLLVTPVSTVDAVEPRGSVSTSVEFPELCPAYLAGATAARGH